MKVNELSLVFENDEFGSVINETKTSKKCFFYRCQNMIFAEDDQFLDDLSNIVDYLFNLTKQKSFYGTELIMRKLVLIKVVMFMYNDDENSPSGCFLCDIDPNKHDYDYLEAAMNLILLIQDFQELSSNAELYELDRMEIFYIRHLSNCKRTKIKALQNEFAKSPTFHHFLKQIIERNVHYNCTVKAYTILSYSIIGVQSLVTSSSSRENVKTLFDGAIRKPDQLRASIFKCIKCIYSAEMKNPESTLDVNILPTMASAIQCHSIR